MKGIVGWFPANVNKNRSNFTLIFVGRQRDSLAWTGLACRLSCLLFFASLVLGVAIGANVQSASHSSAGTGLSFAFADFDGDLRPDLAGIQIGRSDALVTDYWIQIQLSAAGRKTILVVAPSGGLQIIGRDVNGDRAMDLVLTTTWLRQPVAILLNDGHGNFSRVDPTAFPGAFSESNTSWGSETHAAPDTAAMVPQSRATICSGVARLPYNRSRVGSIPPSNDGFSFNPFLISHLGRAPPSEVLHL
jgi:hypothetical protein